MSNSVDTSPSIMATVLMPFVLEVLMKMYPEKDNISIEITVSTRPFCIAAG